MSRREEENQVRNALLGQMRRGQINRRQFLIQSVAAGLAMGGVGVAMSGCGPTATEAPPPTAVPATEAAATEAAVEAATEEVVVAEARQLSPTFYQWIVDLHPSIEQINAEYPGGVNFQIAPVEGFDLARFMAEGKKGESTWDVYVGMTPFVEMGQMVEAGVIEPWDDYIPKDVLDDLIPSIRQECMYKGKLYVWPFLLDVIVQAYNAAIVEKAGLPDEAPADWDTYLAASQTVLDTEAALYGCTFDAHGWRCLAPITHSISTDCYYDWADDPSGSGEPLFDFTSAPALEALEILKKMLVLSASNALQPGTTDGGVNSTPDEVAFAAQKVAYWIKYQNAPLRMAGNWTDPKNLRLGALPSGGEGATVFWDTGCALFKYGTNKEAAAEYLTKLTYDMRIWKDSIGGSESGHPGHLPPYKSIYAEWEANPPDWLLAEPWVPLVRGQLDVAKAIPNNPFGLQQFIIGQPFWEKYLKDEESDPMVAMQAAKDAVQEEILKVA